VPPTNADGVDGVDAGVSLQRPQGRLVDRGVEPVGVGLFDQGSTETTNCSTTDV
jgi:hypothetical protein